MRSTYSWVMRRRASHAVEPGGLERLHGVDLPGGPVAPGGAPALDDAEQSLTDRRRRRPSARRPSCASGSSRRSTSSVTGTSPMPGPERVASMPTDRRASVKFSSAAERHLRPDRSVLAGQRVKGAEVEAPRWPGCRPRSDRPAGRGSRRAGAGARRRCRRPVGSSARPCRCAVAAHAATECARFEHGHRVLVVDHRKQCWEVAWCSPRRGRTRW